MSNRIYLSLVMALILGLYTTRVPALTVQQFSDICASAPGECSDLPVIQAYVGGALDLLATLDEQTEYLETLYCKEPKKLFDMAAIVRFMQQQPEQFANSNAMLLLIHYVEKNGGCEK
ncbi:hypothetical protein [Lacimicrobium sp. SS2-24]|uniref:hypothetical protein n=1 Tax=Lacimicrobium sp. SS2-24 TaxID=2005569 RepID=UPI000B4BA114|nr:hypothetical protein [Lacimicrobium sp. SS2-24]